MKKIVIAIDSFKGSLTSAEAGEAAAQGVRELFPRCNIVQLPVADGGEGMLEVLVEALHGRYVTTTAHDARMQPRTVRYGLSADSRTAIIEMAAICGLPLLPPNQRNPLLTTTYGVGEVIREALDSGCRHFIIGIGGSATNDAGMGMLQALGIRLLDRQGEEVGTGGGLLADIARIDTSAVHPALAESTFTIACDVDNPFHGPQGATRVYAPQKGATPEMVEALEAGMRSVARVMTDTTGHAFADTPGAGAAGGIGGAFLAFMQARLMRGIDLILHQLQFNEKIQGADLILTGEGRADGQTARGKVAYGILQAAQRQAIPVVLLTGQIADSAALRTAGFSGIFSIAPGPIALSQALDPAFAKAQLRRTVTELCRFAQALKR